MSRTRSLPSRQRGPGSIGVIIPHFDISTADGRLWNSRRLDRERTVQGIGLDHQADDSGRTEDPADTRGRELQGFQRHRDQRAAEVQGRSGGTRRRERPGKSSRRSRQSKTGLVDKIGFIEDAITRATELSGYNADDVRCVKYEPSPTLMGELFGGKSQAAAPTRGEAELAQLIDLASPRAYYLWTWLPTLMSNSH